MTDSMTTQEQENHNPDHNNPSPNPNFMENHNNPNFMENHNNPNLMVNHNNPNDNPNLPKLHDKLCLYFGPVFTKVFARFTGKNRTEHPTPRMDDRDRVKLRTEITALLSAAPSDFPGVYQVIWRYHKDIDDVLPFLEHILSDEQPVYSNFQQIQDSVQRTPRIPMYYKLLSLLYSRDNDNHEISELEYQAMVTDLQPILNGIQSPSTSYIMYTNLAQAYLHTLYSSRHTPHCTTYDIMYVILVALLFLLVGLSIASVLKCR